MDWKFIMCLLVMCSTTIWKLLEILTYGEIQVRQVDDVMTLYMAFTIYAAYKAGMAYLVSGIKSRHNILCFGIAIYHILWYNISTGSNDSKEPKV